MLMSVLRLISLRWCRIVVSVSEGIVSAPVSKQMCVHCKAFTSNEQRARARTRARTQERFEKTAQGREHVRTRKNALSFCSRALAAFTSSERAFLEYSIETLRTHSEQRKNALRLFTLK
ncbi:hypothetical protein B5X24_HaOG203062 [Helicoverpa armigera]|uniref:Secreted protein n=1 Tax=Helicoverpa armigera TaxID=29058 RepID=A0A2W1BVM4_HELAM|nr:hypothetical protein B5X24_HaOG203062 [Helicoverpa armigera]